jgi:hypothetical protein
MVHVAQNAVALAQHCPSSGGDSVALTNLALTTTVGRS